jgi:hypothetical protein
MRARRLQRLLIAVALVGALFVVGCSGDGDNPGAPAATTTPPITTPGPTLTPDPSDPTPSSTIEVQGVVGVVNERERTIDIRPTGAEQFTKIALGPNTVIQRAGGGELSLEEVRPSDRIIAYGRVGDDPDTLVSDDVTVQPVIPGASPGG